MDIWTKVFLINWVLIIFLMAVDRMIMHDAIEKNRLTGPLFGLWALLGLVSVPCWVVRLIISN